jgi:rSAM/selenodomain-associated transferase 1
LSVEETLPARSVAIAVMAKAPVPGQTKTRLVPPLDPEGAAALSAAFLRDMTENIAQAARDVPLVSYVAYMPAGAERSFECMLADGASLLLADGSPPMPPGVRGIGGSLLHAMQSLLAAGHAGACLLNADSPTLPTSFLVTAATALLAPGERVVLGPAEDGGYYLIGMQTPHAHLFQDIDWSTDRVAAQTRERARTLGLEVLELPAWYDVDDCDGLARLLVGFETPVAEGPRPYEAHATMACVRRLRVHFSRGAGEMQVGADDA